MNLVTDDVADMRAMAKELRESAIYREDAKGANSILRDAVFFLERGATVLENTKTVLRDLTNTFDHYKGSYVSPTSVIGRARAMIAVEPKLPTKEQA